VAWNIGELQRDSTSGGHVMIIYPMLPPMLRAALLPILIRRTAAETAAAAAATATPSATCKTQHLVATEKHLKLNFIRNKAVYLKLQ